MAYHIENSGAVDWCTPLYGKMIDIIFCLSEMNNTYTIKNAIGNTKLVLYETNKILFRKINNFVLVST